MFRWLPVCRAECRLDRGDFCLGWTAGLCRPLHRGGPVFLAPGFLQALPGLLARSRIEPRLPGKSRLDEPGRVFVVVRFLVIHISTSDGSVSAARNADLARISTASAAL